jgi:hypothetical protein
MNVLDVTGFAVDQRGLSGEFFIGCVLPAG